MNFTILIELFSRYRDFSEEKRDLKIFKKVPNRDHLATLEKINKDRYVNDVATGGSREEVDRMVGKCVGGTNKFETNGTLSQILSNGSLKLKAIVTSGETDKEKISKLGSFVLGTGWDPTLDQTYVDVCKSDALREVLDYADIIEFKMTPRRGGGDMLIPNTMTVSTLVVPFLNQELQLVP